MEIIRVREQVVDAGMHAAEREKALVGKTTGKTLRVSARASVTDELSRVRDLRDMLTLLRTMQIKPQEGRRKDLKKVETIISDLELLTAGWG